MTWRVAKAATSGPAANIRTSEGPSPHLSSPLIWHKGIARPLKVRRRLSKAKCAAEAALHAPNHLFAIFCRL